MKHAYAVAIKPLSVSQPEPWLRGQTPVGAEPIVVPVLHSFQQVREDLKTHVAGLDADAVWCEVAGTTLGFHLKHMAGSVDRLLTYLEGKQLSADQMSELRAESRGDEDADTLLAALHALLANAEQRLREIDPAAIYEPRAVGRRELPTNVIGLLVHVAEHTQRHLGQAIILAKIARESA